MNSTMPWKNSVLYFWIKISTSPFLIWDKFLIDFFPNFREKTKQNTKPWARTTEKINKSSEEGGNLRITFLEMKSDKAVIPKRLLWLHPRSPRKKIRKVCVVPVTNYLQPQRWREHPNTTIQKCADKNSETHWQRTLDTRILCIEDFGIR